jgi:asparagine synthase (glutamine-hydrolysing)
MCGIAGFVGPTPKPNVASAVLRRMTDVIRYRGPDDSGAWFDSETPVALGHRRLSILDLSPMGHQPMTSVSGRYVIVFNGEIYNYLTLRDELVQADAAVNLEGRSDTAVMLAAFDRWGIKGALPRLNGMFAFAVFDRSERKLILARDRIGEKPLYFTQMGGCFIFASELKAVKQHPAWNSRIDRRALLGYLRYSYVRGDQSIYEGVSKVRPGTMVTLDVAAPSYSHVDVFEYWSAGGIIGAALERPLALSDEEAIEQLTELLCDSVRLRMVADVPLGAFLSGGIDSSTVVAIMQRISTNPVKTFSIGFGEPRFNEAESARAVAKHLGTEHVELYVTPRESLDVIPQLPQMFDEPFADASQIPTHIVSRLARQHVTVSLSGDGGDELFCGYERYEIVENLWRTLERMPRLLRGTAAAAVQAVPIRALDFIGGALPVRLTAGRAGDRIHKLAQRFRANSFREVFESLLRTWDEPRRLLVDGGAISGRGEHPLVLREDCSAREQMMAFDLVTYLPDDILVKMDRASMAVSLEARIPLLDHRLVEFAWRLPMTFKRRDGVSKWLLREVLYRLVPRKLVDRPKQGFGVPIEHWLRTDLREWAEDLLAPTRVKADGYLDSAVVSAHLEEHLSGRRSWASQLWNVLMFQAWLRNS